MNLRGFTECFDPNDENNFQANQIANVLKQG
jgi:hypothetical protein